MHHSVPRKYDCVYVNYLASFCFHSKFQDSRNENNSHAFFFFEKTWTPEEFCVSELFRYGKNAAKYPCLAEALPEPYNFCFYSFKENKSYVCLKFNHILKSKHSNMLTVWYPRNFHNKGVDCFLQAFQEFQLAMKQHERNLSIQRFKPQMLRKVSKIFPFNGKKLKILSVSQDSLEDMKLLFHWINNDSLLRFTWVFIKPKINFMNRSWRCSSSTSVIPNHKNARKIWKLLVVVGIKEFKRIFHLVLYQEFYCDRSPDKFAWRGRWTSGVAKWFQFIAIKTAFVE